MQKEQIVVEQIEMLKNFGVEYDNSKVDFPSLLSMAATLINMNERANENERQLTFDKERKLATVERYVEAARRNVEILTKSYITFTNVSITLRRAIEGEVLNQIKVIGKLTTIAFPVSE